MLLCFLIMIKISVVCKLLLVSIYYVIILFFNCKPLSFSVKWKMYSNCARFRIDRTENIFLQLLCGVKKWEMDSRHEYILVVYHGLEHISIYSSEFYYYTAPL